MNSLYSLFHTKSLKSGIYFPFTAHLNGDTKFSLEKLDLCLDFIKFAVGRADSHTQVIPKVLNN